MDWTYEFDMFDRVFLRIGHHSVVWWVEGDIGVAFNCISAMMELALHSLKR